MMKWIGCVACFLVGVAWSESSGTASPSQAGIQIAVPLDPSSVGYLNLTKRHPDGSDGPTEFATAYSPASAVQRLDQIRGFLKSFEELTARARGTLTEAELSRVGNTDGAMQNVGFHNIPLIVEGTLLKQDYQLTQAQYELAQLRLARGDVTVAEVERARAAYAAATQRLQLFWDTKRPVD
jgi:hypothetical protein